ncbi:MAG: hypothetical protein V3U75_07710 [Methylococcaceae bacterium]
MSIKFIVSQSDLNDPTYGVSQISQKKLSSRNSIPELNGQIATDRNKSDQKLFILVKKLRIMLSNIVLLLLSTTAFANHNDSQQYFERGVAVTGVNDLCGSPVFNLPAPEGISPTIHATMLGEYNRDGKLPIPLSPTNCNDDIVLSTHTDLDFLARTGQPDIDSRLKNIPLRDVPVISNPDGSRSVVPSLENVQGNALPITKSNPNNTITLGNWLDAQGWMLLRCNANGTAKVKLRLKNLIPNGVYTVWGIWNTTPPGASKARILPVPLGGIPNVVTPDSAGKATFSRELASCPKDVTDNGSILLFIDLAYHSDGNVSGAFPQIGAAPTQFKMTDGTKFSSPLVPGAVTHDQMLFLISGEKL